jgi:hypothetical protein
LRQLDRLKKHLRTIKIVSGGFLIFIGALIIFGRLQQLNILLSTFAYRLETWDAENPVVARNVFGAVFLFFTSLVAFFYIRKGVKSRTNEDEVTTEKPQDVPAASVRSAWIRPFRLFFILAFFSVGVLSFTGVINLPSVLSAWFSFQGI